MHRPPTPVQGLPGRSEISTASSAPTTQIPKKLNGIIHIPENTVFALRLPNNTPQGPRKRAVVLMGARTPPRCHRAARRRSRGRGRHAVRARRVSRAAFGSSPFAPAVRDAVRAAIRARVAPPYTGLAGWRPLWRDAREFFGARGRRRAWTSYQVLLCAVRTIAARKTGQRALIFWASV